MKNFVLDMYRQMFLSLKRGRSSCGSKSNAKPIFLISIIETIPLLRDNLFVVSNFYLLDFYKTNCMIYDNKITPIILPYYHMHTEPFYEICWKEEIQIPEIKHSPSIKYLSKFIDGVKLDDQLWILLQDKENREYLKDSIITHYFSHK